MNYYAATGAYRRPSLRSRLFRGEQTQTPRGEDTQAPYAMGCAACALGCDACGGSCKSGPSSLNGLDFGNPMVLVGLGLAGLVAYKFLLKR